MSNHPPQNLTVATTGASGALFLRHFLLAVERDERVKTVNFVASESALRVIAEEIGIEGRDKLVDRLLGKASAKIQQQSNSNIGANIASGSYLADGMVVLPCSAGTLSRIANGDASHLIERAADVCLKERRPLVLVVRETPLTLIDLENMVGVTRAGAIVLPAMPAFHNRPKTVDEMVNHVVGKVLDVLGVGHDLVPRWDGQPNSPP